MRAAFAQLQRTMTVGSLLLAAIFAPAALLAWKGWGGTGYLVVTVTGGIVGAVLTLIYARCPACRVFLGRQMSIVKRCPRCRARFR